MEQKYFEVKNKYLAEALAFFGFKYLKFDDGLTNKKIYSFQDSEEIRRLMSKLISMKKEYMDSNIL